MKLQFLATKGLELRNGGLTKQAIYRPFMRRAVTLLAILNGSCTLASWASPWLVPTKCE